MLLNVWLLVLFGVSLVTQNLTYVLNLEILYVELQLSIYHQQLLDHQIVADETTLVAPDDIIKIPTARSLPIVSSNFKNLSRAEIPER